MAEIPDWGTANYGLGWEKSVYVRAENEEICTPPGMNLPASVAPSLGTMRGSIAVAAPAHRMPSLTAARRRGIASSPVMSVGQCARARSAARLSWKEMSWASPQRMWASVREVVSVPGPSISLASERATGGGRRERIMVEMKFGCGSKGGFEMDVRRSSWEDAHCFG